MPFLKNLVLYSLGLVDFVASNDDKYEETNGQFIKGILKETSSVTLELMKLFRFSKLELLVI